MKLGAVHVTVSFRGAADGQFTYGGCDSQITKYIKDKVKPVLELSDKPVYIFSYFFDRAVEAGLICKFSV